MTEEANDNLSSENPLTKTNIITRLFTGAIIVLLPFLGGYVGFQYGTSFPSPEILAETQPDTTHVSVGNVVTLPNDYSDSAKIGFVNEWLYSQFPDPEDPEYGKYQSSDDPILSFLSDKLSEDLSLPNSLSFSSRNYSTLFTSVSATPKLDPDYDDPKKEIKRTLAITGTAKLYHLPSGWTFDFIPDASSKSLLPRQEGRILNINYDSSGVEGYDLRIKDLNYLDEILSLLCKSQCDEDIHTEDSPLQRQIVVEAKEFEFPVHYFRGGTWKDSIIVDTISVK